MTDFTKKESLTKDEARSWLTAIIESSDDAILSKDLNGFITSWNRGAEALFGYTASETIGNHVSMLIPTPRHDEEPAILDRIRRGQSIDHYETVRRRKDGKLINISLTVSPIRNSNGEIIGASKIARDITERLQHDREREVLLQSERAARSEAERALRLRDEFLAVVSHELRTPLNGIVGWTQLLKFNLVKDALSKEDLAEGIGAISRGATALTQLIEDILDMNRILAGKLQLESHNVNPAAIIEAAVLVFTQAAETKGIKLVSDLEPLPMEVAADSARLQQVLSNLLANAIKFTPERGTVTVSLRRTNSNIEISVRDTGIGIKPEYIPRVFDRFSQADSSSSRRFGGLGLGLSIAKQLVELHGGAIRAESAGECLGATFIVTLPLVSQAQFTHPLPIPEPGFQLTDVNLAGLRVLVVEDQPDTLDLITRVLLKCKADVFPATNGQEAWEEFQKYMPHILVSDIGMPDVDGYQLINKIRKLPASKGGKVHAIALTAFARSEDRTRALRAGYQMHISKPLDPHELVATVASFKDRIPENEIR